MTRPKTQCPPVKPRPGGGLTRSAATCQLPSEPCCQTASAPPAEQSLLSPTTTACGERAATQVRQAPC
eukprot:1067941-Prymnesium_polylepis.1